ncbi:hypothetical protein HPB48_019038 [Haemaphysalis longicornis]|uniref:Uncharacterized protein n=1 Tax=Haemaphysalis longicornis TaxID=44386 RepID=A0A9J6GHT5_HAELO|nr:hypothetical protein HPB48_019038 [Haemaphysalis longicornis]
MWLPKGERKKGWQVAADSNHNTEAHWWVQLRDAHVDKSDQPTGSHNVLHKCVRSWKALLFHCTGTAAVNSHVIVQGSDRKQHPEIA